VGLIAPWSPSLAVCGHPGTGRVGTWPAVGDSGRRGGGLSVSRGGVGLGPAEVDESRRRDTEEEGSVVEAGWMPAGEEHDQPGADVTALLSKVSRSAQRVRWLRKMWSTTNPETALMRANGVVR